MFPFVSSLLSLGAPNRFSSVWDANLKTAVAATTTSPEYPAHCKLAVVGAGWGGAYFAWRMAVDTKTVDAKDVCVFEANGRVGGRIYSIHGLPNFADLAVDVPYWNGVSSTLDILWAGSPLVALSGELMLSRMSAALLAALAVPHSVVHSLRAYQDAALALVA